MRGRLAVTANFANSLDAIAERLEAHVAAYESSLTPISSANIAIIERLEEDPSQIEDAMDFALAIRGLATISRESLSSLSELLTSMEENARLSRVLRAPTKRVLRALDRFASATQRVDEWDRRLQALGVPLPLSSEEGNEREDTGSTQADDPPGDV